MSIDTQPRLDNVTERTDLESRLPTSLIEAGNIINRAIEKARDIPDTDADQKLEKLIACDLRLRLIDVVAANEMKAFLDSVPAARKFIEELRSAAGSTIQETIFDSDASTIVHNIGAAADIAQDRELLQDLAGALKNALEDTQDYSLDIHQRACKIALEQDELYTTAYRQLSTGKTAVTASTQLDPPRELSNDPNLNTFLNKEEVRKIDIGNLFHESKTFDVPELNPDFQFLYEHQARKIGRSTLLREYFQRYFH